MGAILALVLLAQAEPARVKLTAQSVRAACVPQSPFLSRGTIRCPAAKLKTACNAVDLHPEKVVAVECLDAIAESGRCLAVCDAAAAGALPEDKTYCNCANGPGILTLAPEEKEAMAARFAARMPSPSLAPSPAPSGWEAIAVEGITRFFVARAEQELLLFVQKQIAGDLCDDANALARLLPATCGVLRPAGTTFAGQTFATLPNAVRTDVTELPPRLVSVAIDQLPEAAELTGPDRDVLCAVSVGISMVPSLRSGLSQFATLDRTLRAATPKGCQDASWKRGQEMWKWLGAVVIQAGEDTARFDAVPPDLREKLFAALNSANVPAGAEVREVAGNLAAPLEEFLAARLALSKAPTNDVLKKEALAASARLLGVLFTALASDEPSRDTVRALWNAVDALVQRQFSEGLLRLFALPPITRAIEAVPDAKVKALLSQIQRHLPLLTALADARSSEDVEKALHAAAAPVTSWREYRRRPGAVFISGLFGVTAAVEIPTAPNATVGAIVGPALPIGIEVGWKVFNSSSFNLLFSVLDVGSLAATRVEDAASGGKTGKSGTAARTPELTFASVLSLGAWVGFGLGDTPFAVMVGLNWAPANRRYFVCGSSDATCGDPATTPTLRIGAVLGVDLPVFPLF